ncbi:hypothetical protein Mapa_006954 [Marchantia paleacea]|nr:hypothetical protein Mapa_006954 [Marchantia paleacea]
MQHTQRRISKTRCKVCNNSRQGDGKRLFLSSTVGRLVEAEVSRFSCENSSQGQQLPTIVFS